MVDTSAYAETERFVVSHGLRLAVYEHDVAGSAPRTAPAPTVLFVHGYPDSHAVWDEVCAELGQGTGSRTAFHTVRYDVRGAGASQAPRGLAGYRLDVLADDLFAVADEVSPDRPVHVVAHDWGSIQAWHAVTDPRAERRVASFTTISGPCLDHTAHWFRERTRHPTPRGLAQLARQGTKSWYIYAFHVPLAAPLLWRGRLGRNWGELLRRAEGVEPRPGRHPQPTLVPDAVRGINLYRANMLRRLTRPEFRYAKVPVQIITPTRDRFVGAALAEGLERWAPDLQRHTVESGHWGALTRRAGEVAELIRGFVTEIEEVGL
jgi:pimeloyl-ACP methyl ester carboxylesterase